jgi:carboxyl-terminal processing protease
MKRARYIAGAVVIAAVLFLLFERASVLTVSARSSAPKNLYLLEAVIRLIQKDYLEEKDPVRTMDGSFKGLVNSLDSNSGYLDHESATRFLNQKGDLPRDPGVVFYKSYGAFPLVVGLVENSPAEKAGLHTGDLITEINGRPTPAMCRAEVGVYLCDLEEKPVAIKILREDKTLDFSVERAPLSPEPFQFSAQAGTAGILSIARLAAPLINDLKAKTVPGLQKSKRTLILDLRNCHNGDFEEARELINLFLKADAVGYIEKKAEAKKVLPSLEEPALPEIPLVIWVNRATMGPAEAVAAVLQDFKRAKIIGFPMLGLAAENEFFPLEDGTAVLLTSGVFYLNSGVKLWGRVTEPDIKLDDADSGLASYLKKTRSLFSPP